MTTEIELALMAGGAYISSKNEENQIPAPANWAKLTSAPDANSGFEAVTYIKQGITPISSPEIVISYTSTNGDGDIPADLALGAGKFSEQLMQAAQYYLDIKAAAPKDAKITFAGHSLGGGLAALCFVNQVQVPKDASVQFCV